MKDDMKDNMKLERIFEMPRAYTFEMPSTRRWVEDHLIGKTLNLFGGRTRLDHTELVITNDIQPEMEPDTLVDAFDPDAVETLGKFDTVIFDPPYSAFQAVTTYKTKRMQRVTLARESVLRVHPQRVISLGWNSTGMSRERGFRKTHLLIVNHGGSHNDTLILVEDLLRTM